jgi:hypothetical protein
VFIVGTDGNYGPSVYTEFSLDSQNIIDVSITDFNQRPALSVGDLEGKLYAHGDKSSTDVSIDSIEYSTVGEDGPWTAVDEILTSDPEYSWPTNGTAAGAAYKVPVRIEDYVSDRFWFKITVSYT